MKNLIIATVVLFTAISQSSCAQNVTDHKVTDSTSVFKYVVDSYFDLKDALANDRGDSARMAAKSLYDAIDKAPMNKMTADQHKAWMQYEEKLSYNAEHIKSTDDIDHQREHFVSLSSDLFKLMKALNINTVELYYQYCPMANEGKGAYWISDQSKVSNPYMGSKMPSCGSTKETLKANL